MTEEKVSMWRAFPRSFWIANTMEIFERMAWYGFFAVSSLYITGSVSEGALGFTSEQRRFLSDLDLLVCAPLRVQRNQALLNHVGYFGALQFHVDVDLLSFGFGRNHGRKA